LLAVANSSVPCKPLQARWQLELLVQAATGSCRSGLEKIKKRTGAKVVEYGSSRIPAFLLSSLDFSALSHLMQVPWDILENLIDTNLFYFC
jgi:hypothetical protein